MIGVFVYCDIKVEKYIVLVLYDNLIFIFECKFDELVFVEEDLGVWDFFIELLIDGYKLRVRIGNKCVVYKYFIKMMYLGYNVLFVYSVRLYFIMNYDNFLIDIKKYVYIEVEFFYEIELKDLLFIFKDK